MKPAAAVSVPRLRRDAPQGTQGAADFTGFSRLLKPLVTRIYFPDEREANASDPILSSIEDPELRRTLLAREEGGELRFDVCLQGDGQTTFFQFADDR